MKIALLTAGGLAPCLSASIGSLINNYNQLVPDGKLLGYLNGYKGLLLGRSINIPNTVKEKAEILYSFGGSPIGNSRVKLTNAENCVKLGYVKDGEDPLEVAANQLVKDDVNIFHTIGGDDTNTIAAQLSVYLKKNGHDLTVVGLPKTVDNDIFPVTQSLGAWTAAEQGAIFFENIANENTTSSRQLIIHEVMGRHCGWLTAYTAQIYHNRLKQRTFLPELLIDQQRWDVDAVYVPELEINFNDECERLIKLMDEKDSINIFLSEGAGMRTIMKEKESSGEEVIRDAFGHVALDTLNPGQWFAKQFASRLEADKTLVQKSGYFARSAVPNAQDLKLIMKSGALATQMAVEGKSGVVGLDEENKDELSLIDFDRIKGGKPFNTDQDWFHDLLDEIDQPKRLKKH